jgi:hypothetical protein
MKTSCKPRHPDSSCFVWPKSLLESDLLAAIVGIPCTNKPSDHQATRNAAKKRSLERQCRKGHQIGERRELNALLLNEREAKRINDC